MSNLRLDLLDIKQRLISIENNLAQKSKIIEEREKKWNHIDKVISNLRNRNEKLFDLNIGGTLFTASESTLMKEKNSLFYKMISQGSLKSNQEIFFDRSPISFPHILDYLRKGEFDYKPFKKIQLMEIQKDAEFYGIESLWEVVNELTKDIGLVRFEFSGPYVFKGVTAGTNKIEDLTSKNLNIGGICADKPGWLIVELNNEWEFEEIEVGGWCGNQNLWYSGNGGGSKIFTSVDKEKWKSVGTLSSGFANKIVTVKLHRSFGRYIKFEHNNYLGLGYLFIKKIEIE